MSILLWILAGLAVLGLGALLLTLLDKLPAFHRRIPQLDLEIYLDVLLRRGLPGSFMVIRVPRDPRFVQFRKRFDPAGAGLELGFPRAPWSSSYYGTLKEALERRGIAYFTRRVGEDDSQVTEFLSVQTGDDLHATGDLARLVFGEVFRLEPERMVKLYFRNVGAKDVTVQLPRD